MRSFTGIVVASIVAVSASPASARTRAQPRKLVPLALRAACNPADGNWVKAVRERAPELNCEGAQFIDATLNGKRVMVITGTTGGQGGDPSPNAYLFVGKKQVSVDELWSALKVKKLTDRLLLDVLTIALIADVRAGDVAFTSAGAKAWLTDPAQASKLQAEVGRVDKTLTAYARTRESLQGMVCERISLWRVTLFGSTLQREHRDLVLGSGCQI